MNFDVYLLGLWWCFYDIRWCVNDLWYNFDWGEEVFVDWRYNKLVEGIYIFLGVFGVDVWVVCEIYGLSMNVFGKYNYYEIS